ncbi:unnamed protein product [Caenorhabditis auriculariae]|uniref:MADF domain-containing protein n=1 Tax=Caenorhabditis auriculariae TaxID=2777116 RepID=A0A8S1H9H8_9PELO|nr:unnamed protein product [Caenorhabditis auriculariae]
MAQVIARRNRNTAVRMTIIKEVRKRPALWGGRSVIHTTTNLEKNELWCEIAEKITSTTGTEVSIPDIKTIWKNLRDSFARQLKDSEENPTQRRAWPFFDHMSFLRDVLQPTIGSRKRIEACKTEVLNDDDDEELMDEMEDDVIDPTTSTNIDIGDVTTTLSLGKLRRRSSSCSSDESDDDGSSPPTKRTLMDIMAPIRQKYGKFDPPFLDNTTDTLSSVFSCNPPPPITLPKPDRAEAFGNFVAVSLREKSEAFYKKAIVQITEILLAEDVE